LEKIGNCPVCYCSEFRSLYTGRTTRKRSDPAEWHVDKCTACSVSFINPRPSWKELEPYYTRDYPAYQGSHGTEATDEVIVAKARAAGEYRHIPITAGKKILDVGCGGGLFLRICTKLGATATGIEPSPIAAEKARSFGLNVFNGTIEDFETDERFDIITASQVLEHVPDPVSTLTRMKSFLAPGGMIWIAVPNAACRWAKALGWKWDGADLPYHLLHFTPQSLTTAAANSGLKVKRMYTRSEPSIVAYSMHKHLEENWHIPYRLAKIAYRPSMAERLAQLLDARNEGDNLIVELAA
jgi:SAM-dependent methyltransferase